MNYEELLEKAYKEIKIVKSEERFEIPKANAYIEGNKTILVNFLQICNVLRRKPEHFAKFLSRELAALSVRESDRLIFNRKLTTERINEKIIEYTKEFVLCKECKKPDTELIKQGPFLFLHCLACGAKHSVRAKIV